MSSQNKLLFLPRYTERATASEQPPACIPRYTEVATASEELPRFIPPYITVRGHRSPFKRADLDLPLTRHPDRHPQAHHPLRAPTQYLREREEALVDAKRAIFTTFWRAIRENDTGRVEHMLAEGLISPCALNLQGGTPLVWAVSSGHMAAVRHLVSLGADVDQLATGDRDGNQRTPLQVAAAKGNLAAVRFLVEECGADDALIAPDGQLALRLAADGGHGEIVAYLPSRRGGGRRRWKAQHATAMRRARRAGRKIGKWLRIVLFDVPFHLFVYAPVKVGAYLWKHKAGIAHTGAKLIVKTPVYAFRAAKKLPRAVAHVARWLWRVAKATPGKLWRVARILGAWLARSVLRLGGAVADVFGRLFSVLHTVVAAMFRFMRDLTVKDVWNGFCALARAVFVNLPVAVAKGIAALSEASYEAVKALLGGFGKVVWWILNVLMHILLYVPRQMLRIAEVFGRSVAKGFREVMVWYDPKASW